MNRRITSIHIALVLLGLAACTSTGGANRKVIANAGRGSEVTFESLLDEMTDLERLVEHPGDAYQCKQVSSYDRRSREPRVPTDENWFANLDVVGPTNLAAFVRVEVTGTNKEYVVMDEAGPGAIQWIWAAADIENFAGNIRIYLDHSPKPVIDMKMDDLLGGDRKRNYFLSPNLEATPFRGVLTGDSVPFPSPITGQYSMGWNSYLPIPYARHCKVAFTALNAPPYFWFQMEYRKYKPGTPVESFTVEGARAKADKIVKTAKALESPANAGPLSINPSLMPKTMSSAGSLLPGQGTSIQIQGPQQAIYQFVSRLSAQDIPGALRGCLLEIRFDGQLTVQCPLGDFFATAPGTNYYESLPSAVRKDGKMVSSWIMPFKQAALISITNCTKLPVDLETEVVFAKRKWRRNTMYFHAKWRAEENIPTRPRRDWNYASIQGCGRYVGNMLQVANPNKNWWGEGDVKIWFDGESFPSIFGTGTEDYYGYGMCWRDLFTHAYHNQTHCEKPGNSGNVCLSRFHILDDLPFTKSFRFDMEIWHWEDCRMNYAETSWWYALAGSKDNFQTLTADMLRLARLPEPGNRKGFTGWPGE